MKKALYLIIIGVVGLIASCGSSGSSTSYVNPHVQKHQEAHQKFQLDQAKKQLMEDFLEGLEGRYSGYIPCDDCESIKYEIQLNKNYSYTLKLFPDNSEETTITEGFYNITENYLVELDKNGGKRKYLEKLNENILLLDISTAEEHKENVEGYVLVKIL